MSFKGLNLEHSKIESTINEFANIIDAQNEITTKPIRYGQQYIININNEEVKINIFLRDGATTTLVYQVGKKQEISLEFCKYIKEKCMLDERANVNMPISNVPNGEIENYLEYIKIELPSLEMSNETNELCIKYTLVVPETKEKITCVYYNNNTFMICGKPLHLFNFSTSYFTELGLLKIDKIVENTSKIYEVSIEIDDIYEELRISAPIAFGKIPPNTKDIILSSLILKKIDVQMPEYSTYIFSVLRGLEGCLKHFFLTKEIFIPKQFDVFKDNLLKQKYRDIINCDDTCSQLEKIYNHLVKYRHPNFHVSQIDIGTSLIKDKGKAISIINETIELIEESYREISIV